MTKETCVLLIYDVTAGNITTPDDRRIETIFENAKADPSKNTLEKGKLIFLSKIKQNYLRIEKHLFSVKNFACNIIPTK